MNNQQDKRFFLGIHTNQDLMLCAFGNVNGELKVQELQNNNLFTLQKTGNANQTGGKVVILPTNKTISINNINVVINDCDDNNLFAMHNGSIFSSFQQIDQFFRNEPQQKALNDAIHNALRITQQSHTNQQSQQTGRENNTAIHTSLASRKQNHIVNASRSEPTKTDNVYQWNYQTFHVNTNPFEAQKFSNYLSLGNIGGNYINEGRK